MDTNEKEKETVETPTIDYEAEYKKLVAEKEALLKQKEEQDKLIALRAENQALAEELKRNRIVFPDQRKVEQPVITERDKMKQKLDRMTFAVQNYDPINSVKRHDGYGPRAPFAKDEVFNGKPMLQVAGKYLQASTPEEKEAILDDLFKNPWEDENF